MPERDWWIAEVQLSDSFHVTVTELAGELGAGIVAWRPEPGGALPLGAGVVLLMAGGAEATALELLAELPPAPVPRYLVGALADHRLAAAAVRRGAHDYFALPDDLDLLRRTLERDAREARGRLEAGRFAEAERQGSGFETILGRSPILRQTLGQAARVAVHRDVTVLIGGETGTGKELLARAIHYHSPRAAEPFVEINCAAIPANLLESELFGHEKGAFTGAVAAKPGLFEQAHGGTLFLDEVGHLPLELQPKLLRALEGQTIRRVGGQSARRVDVRVIGATHVDLAAAVGQGTFREDLYYRLNVVALTLPPLRQREDDVELLAETFLARLATSYGLPVPPMTPEVRAALRVRRWPGNIRELRNAIERALVLSPPGTLRPDELGSARSSVDPDGGPLPFPSDLNTLVRAAANATLQLTGGNKSEAARRLGISRPRLQRLLDGLTDTE
ncbi:MAG: sigma-54-dependent Fis family transcriptional regulator [Gemmatimonadales bacterium]|nr:sigma-54-dependent Fis family transcriptional regulator [Gemmatimonadales bacterium]